MTQPRPATLMPAKAMCPAAQRFRTTAKSTGTGPGLLCAKIAFIGANTETQAASAAAYGIVAAWPSDVPECPAATGRAR